MRDELIYGKIKQATQIIDEIDNLINTQSTELKNVDLEISDWLHFIENNEINEKQSIIIINKLKELRLIRKSLHKEYTIEKAYKDNSSKMMGNNTRQLLLTEINKVVKQWENEYNNRVLNDEEIKNIIDNTKKKVGRPKKIKLEEENDR